MILLLNTSTSLCRLTIIDNEDHFEYEWQADRQLARGLHEFMHTKLQKHGWDWRDISGIGAYLGPGSFTGLRIGLTVLNTLADSLDVPIVGAAGDGWHKTVLLRLEKNEDDRILLPQYGGAAHITKPRK
tara:strand:+ start:10010 stop:10396 length:387 start_codon:yes stop_codon:yes gene_type:complete